MTQLVFVRTSSNLH